MNTREPAHTPLYLDLYLKLRDRIERGEYAPGSKLPSEKAIAEASGVSRITSKHALDRLAAEGYLKRFPGRGSYVQAREAAPAAENAVPAAPAAPKLLGLVMEELTPYFGADILLGVEQACAAAGWSLLVKFTFVDEAREKTCVEELLAAGVSGIVMMCAYVEVYSPTILKLYLEGFPLVFLDRSLKGLPMPYIGTDHAAAARALTDALIARGHTQLALAMGEDSNMVSSVEERIQGYMASCIDHGLICANRRVLLRHEPTPAPDSEARQINIGRLNDFLARFPDTTALVALSSRVGFAVCHALRRGRGRAFDIGCFDGPRTTFPASYGLLWVEQDEREIGRRACETLLRRIRHEDVGPQTLVPFRIMSSL